MKQQILVIFFSLMAFYAMGQKKPNSLNGFKNYTETTNAVNIEMVAIKGDTFTMGSPESEPDHDIEEMQHSVSLSDFYMSATPVTCDQYNIFCTATNRSKPEDKEGRESGNGPVIIVSWDDATAYCQWLSQKTGKTYRLPTEAEWEYACRAGTTTPFSTGSKLSTTQANFNDTRGKTTPVGSYSPNPWGLYDMHGNVWEWCNDWYASDYYSSSPQANPQGPASGSYRVTRGGSWVHASLYCRSAYRSFESPQHYSSTIGFRIVCSR